MHLERFEVLEKDPARAYFDAIQPIIESLETWPPPWARALLAVVGVNRLAIVLVLLSSGRGGLERWLPFIGYSGAGVLGLAADFMNKAHLDPWVFGGLLIIELFALIMAGLVSPRYLRWIAQIEPLNHVAVSLGLRCPWSRRRFFEDYIKEVKTELEADRRRSNEEQYLALPASVRSQDPLRCDQTLRTRARD